MCAMITVVTRIGTVKISAASWMLFKIDFMLIRFNKPQDYSKAHRRETAH